MGEEKTTETTCWCRSGWKPVHWCGCGSAVYWLGFFGAAVYYIQTATSLWMGIVGVVKAFFWPAFLAYGALHYLGM